MLSQTSEREIKVVLHGSLKELYPHEIKLTGSNPAEIINGMCKITKAFNPKPGEERHVVQVLGYETEDALYAPFHNDNNELHIIPAMIGGKSGGGFFKIIIGAVLIAASFFLPAGPLIAGYAATSLSALAFNFGLSLVLGGLLELISPQPKADGFGNSAADPEASKYLGSTANTVKIGTRIPIMYGEVLAYGHYISFDVDAKDVDTTT